MRNYYYSDGHEKFGPFTLERLKQKYITRKTLIWYEGLSDWTLAEQIVELRFIFQNEPPNVRNMQQPRQNNFQRPPKTWLLESILVTLFCCWPFGIAGIVNASRVESRFYAGDEEGAIRASEEAGKWTKIAFWVMLGLVGLYILLMVLGVASSIALPH